jgi:NAD-dependent SIR2 family protein deacetylase
MVEAYCVKCKAKVQMKDGKETKTARGTNMMKGKCPKCGTTVCRMMGKK